MTEKDKEEEIITAVSQLQEEVSGSESDRGGQTPEAFVCVEVGKAAS